MVSKIDLGGAMVKTHYNSVEIGVPAKIPPKVPQNQSEPCEPRTIAHHYLCSSNRCGYWMPQGVQCTKLTPGSSVQYLLENGGGELGCIPLAVVGRGSQSAII